MRSLQLILLGVAAYLQLAAAADDAEAYNVPADFPWDRFREMPGLYMLSSDAVSQGLTADDFVPNSTDIIPIAAIAGYGWQVFGGVISVAGTASTIQGCIQNEGVASAIFACFVGLASTLIGIGSAASAAKTYAKSKGFFGVAANTWSASGLENIALDVFSKRDFVDDAEEAAQNLHNALVFHAVRSLSPDAEFIGYAGDTHRLAKRSSDVHPYAPVFRLRHSHLGPMDIVSRDVGGENGLHFTVAYADHPGHIKRTEYFQHERVQSNLVEGRFSSAASDADPNSISFSASGAFNQLVEDIECFTDGTWKDGSVLNVQAYDTTNKATFAFGSLGIFENPGVDDSFAAFDPTGQPLEGGENCPGN